MGETVTILTVFIHSHWVELYRFYALKLLCCIFLLQTTMRTDSESWCYWFIFSSPDRWSSFWCLCSGADNRPTTPVHSPSAQEILQQPITSWQTPSTLTCWATLPPAVWWRAAVRHLNTSAAHQQRRWLRRYLLYSKFTHCLISPNILRLRNVLSIFCHRCWRFWIQFPVQKTRQTLHSLTPPLQTSWVIRRALAGFTRTLATRTLLLTAVSAALETFWCCRGQRATKQPPSDVDAASELISNDRVLNMCALWRLLLLCVAPPQST